MHRFLPALLLREGYRGGFRAGGPSRRAERRARNTPTWGACGPALSDIAGVVWLRARARDPGRVEEVQTETSEAGSNPLT